MVLEVLSNLSGAVILWSCEYLFNVVEYLVHSAFILSVTSIDFVGFGLLHSKFGGRVL